MGYSHVLGLIVVLSKNLIEIHWYFFNIFVCFIIGMINYIRHKYNYSHKHFVNKIVYNIAIHKRK